MSGSNDKSGPGNLNQARTTSGHDAGEDEINKDGVGSRDHNSLVEDNLELRFQRTYSECR